MAEIKLSDYILGRLPEVTHSGHIFLLSGGGMMHLLDSAGRSEMKVIPVHHEQAAAIAADAYGRVGNTIGVCFVTTGPGCTNAITGVAGAFMESTPLLVISGQVSRANSRLGLAVRQKGIQEVDIVPIVQSITKYAVLVREPDSIRYHLEKAAHLARSGRPGPVWLDIPLDVQAATIRDAGLRGFDPAEITIDENPAPARADIDNLLAALRSSKRPLVILGGGVHLAGARTEARRLVQLLGVPVQTSWNGMDVIPETHPLFFGRANVFGTRWANFVIQNCDFLLSIGARLGLQHTGYNVRAFAREAFKVMIDVDEGEMSKPGLDIDLRIRADVGKMLKALIHELETAPLTQDLSTWMAYCEGIRSKYPPRPDPGTITDAPYVSPYDFTARLCEHLPPDCVVPFGSSGMCHTVTGSVFRVKDGQRVFTSKGLAAMGYGVPSSLGACIASGGKLTVTVVGDGGLQLNLQELQTIRHHGLPVKIFVLNNDGYHSIRTTQANFFQGRLVASSRDSGVSCPNLSKVADLFGFQFARIARNHELDGVMREVLAREGPSLCEVMIDPEQKLEPKLVSYVKSDGTMESRPLEDMAPLLDRAQFYADMIVRPIT